MANIVTCSRIICSIILLFLPVFSPWFYILYLVCRITDIIDGTIARRTNTVSKLGSKLDTAADLIFTAVCLAKLLPEIHIPGWLWIWLAVIAAIKIINVASGFVYWRRFVAEHTVANKVTGALLFLLPLTINFIDLRYSAVVVCCMATFAAIQEGHFIRTGQEIV